MRTTRNYLRPGDGQEVPPRGGEVVAITESRFGAGTLAVTLYPVGHPASPFDPPCGTVRKWGL